MKKKKSVLRTINTHDYFLGFDAGYEQGVLDIKRKIIKEFTSGTDLLKKNKDCD